MRRTLYWLSQHTSVRDRKGIEKRTKGLTTSLISCRTIHHRTVGQNPIHSCNYEEINIQENASKERNKFNKYHYVTNLKPQDSFGEFGNFFFFLIFRKCRKSSENTIRPSCKCLEWHIVMQYCPMVNYYDVHNQWQSVRGDSEHLYVFVIFKKWKHFEANY